jgi:hypothetical protein
MKVNHPASYKDNAARVYLLEPSDQFIYRDLSPEYLPHFKYFIDCGLSEFLKKREWIPQFEILQVGNNITLKAPLIDFVTYPYEWSFSQWKIATQLTLRIQYYALKFGMTLKDATPFNIVFRGSSPVFIDLSSFEVYRQGSSWIAMKQFFESLYSPLLLLKYRDTVANQIFLTNLHGIPLGIASQLLPLKARFHPNNFLFFSIAKLFSREKDSLENQSRSFLNTQNKLMNFVKNLYEKIDAMQQKVVATSWNKYYQTHVASEYFTEKFRVVNQWAEKYCAGSKVIDFGSNVGVFSFTFAKYAKSVIAMDADIRAVDEMFTACKKNNITNLYCINVNFATPSPSVGWRNTEYVSLENRLSADVGIALALIHHMAITYYINFNMLADFFSSCCKRLIVEFVPDSDDKVQLLINGRNDNFNWYNADNFLSAFEKRFHLIDQYDFKNQRQLFHFLRHES